MFGILIFIFLSLCIVIFVNYYFYKIFYFKIKETKLIHIMISAFFSFFFSTLLVDTFDPIARIIEGLILNYKKINIDGIILVLRLKYIWEFWIEDIILYAIMIAPISLIITFIISLKYKKNKFTSPNSR